MELGGDQTVEKRLVGTLITEKPHSMSFLVCASILLIMAFLSQIYWQNWWSLAEFLPARKDFIFGEGQWWRALSAVFIHADIGHFFSNAYMLGVFSYFVFGHFGFGLYPLSSFVIAALVNVIAISTYPPEVRLLGASGLVYVLGGLWLTLYFLIQRQFSIVNRTFRVIGVSLMVFFPTTFVPTTSYRTHAIGFACGVVMGIIYYNLNRFEILRHEKYKYISI